MNKKIIIKNICFSIISGLLITFAFPEFNHNWVVWTGLVPFLDVIHREKPLKSFIYGWIFGITFMGSLLYWLMVLPGGFLALFLFSLLYSIPFAVFSFFLSWLKCNFQDKKRAVYISPFLWVTMEWISGQGFMGFTWAYLGHSQYKFISLIQIASITGVAGISFLIITVNEFIRELFSFCLKRVFSSGTIDNRKTFIYYFLLIAVLFSSFISFGLFKITSFQNEPEPSTCKVAILQPNIPQIMKWDPPHGPEIVGKYFRMTREAALEKPFLIIWPETAIPGYLLQNPPLLEAIKNLAIETKTCLLIGGLDKEVEKNMTFNTAVLFSPEGETAGKYNKIHLVPFGEYLPGRSYFEKVPFLEKFIKPISSFSPGDKGTVFNTQAINFSVVICFESIFPQSSRSAIMEGAEMLVVITNDAWFQKTAAPFQHNIISVFRAIENERFIVRCANTGVSSVIDPLGRILESTPIYEDKIIYGNIYPVREKTFYSSYGDIFSILCLLVSLIIVIYTVVHKKGIFNLFRKKTELKNENNTNEHDSLTVTAGDKKSEG